MAKKRRKPTEGEVPEVRICWMDACAPDNMDCFTKEEALTGESLDMWDYGILLGENQSKNAWVLASNFSSAGTFRRLMVIPKKYVKQIDVLGYMRLE